MADDRLRSALKLAAHDLRVSDDWPANLDARDIIDKYLVAPTVSTLELREAALRIFADRSLWAYGDWVGPGGEVNPYELAAYALGLPVEPYARAAIEAAIEAQYQKMVEESEDDDG